MKSFNGKMREECLNAHWWRTIEEARRAIDTFREDHNKVRPHSALNYQTPEEFVKRSLASPKRRKLASSIGSN